jgi:hypothetical protein
VTFEEGRAHLASRRSANGQIELSSDRLHSSLASTV